MAEIVYTYQKVRREFGRHPEFQDSEPELLIDTHPNASLQEQFIRQDPYETEIQCVPEISENSTNTERIRLKPQGMYHVEGGWPAGVDPTEMESKIKYTKKAEREESYIHSCKVLVEPTEKYLKQNNAIDIYEDYFAADTADHSSEPPTAKTLTVLTDPSPIKRGAVSLSWHQDGRKLAIAYCQMKFQGNTEGMSLKSHIWDINNPNAPDVDLVPSSPLCCVQFNPKDQYLVAGGSYNGVVQYWDTRNPRVPVGKSQIEDSHKDPIYDLKWLMSKTGEVLTVSTDGTTAIWDVKKMDKPIEGDVVQLQPKNNDGGCKGILGGLCLDYDPLVGGPSKYMVGTEQGTTLSCNRRGKSPQDKISQTFNGHHGPVYSVMRNTFFAKFFLTVGDWTARVWCDEIKTPMFMTFYHKAYLTSGSWHPVRPGVFLTTRMDGRLDVWDLMYKQTAAVLSVQVSNYALHTHKYVQTLASPLCLCAPALRHVCLFRVHMEWARDKVRCAQTRSPDAEPAMLLFLLRIQQDGRVVAAGGVDGITSLLELSPNLGELAKDEKSLIGLMFEREATRDKNLIQRAREMKQKRKKSDAAMRPERNIGNVEESELQQITDSFWKDVKKEEEKAVKKQEEVKAHREELMKEIDNNENMTFEAVEE